MNDFGGYVRTAREGRGLTPADLALALGRDKSYVSRLETGRNKQLPEPDEMATLADALAVPVRDLLSAAGYDLGDDAPPLRPAARQIGALTADLTDRQLDRLLLIVTNAIALMRGDE